VLPLQSLAPIYEKLAKRFSKVDSVVIAKMDGTENEHPDIESQVCGVERGDARDWEEGEEEGGQGRKDGRAGRRGWN
jgi:hypothetical protein